MRNFRFGRIVHVLLLLGFGIVLGLVSVGTQWRFMAFDSVIFSVAALSMAFEWFSAVCYNDVRDES